MPDDTNGAPNVPVGDFLIDTQVTPDPDQPGRFDAHLSEAWQVFYAFGGATMAVAVRAAQAAVDRHDLAPVSATATFAAPVPCGPITVDTRVLRAGKSAAQVTADLHAGAVGAGEQPDTDLHLSAIFGKAHASHVDFTEAAFPDDVLDVDDSMAMPTAPPGDSPFANINFHHQTEWRIAKAGAAIGDPSAWEPGPARSLTWHRLVNEPRLEDGTIDPIAYCVAADILAPAIFARLGPLGPDNPPFLMLSLEIGLQWLAPTTSTWLLQHTQVQQVRDGYAYGRVELWDVDRNLVAIATQRGHVRPVAMERFAAPDGTA